MLTDNEAGGDLTCDGVVEYTAYFINLGNEPADITATLELPGDLSVELTLSLRPGPPPQKLTVLVNPPTKSAETFIAQLGVEASGIEIHVEGSEPTVLPHCETQANDDEDATAAPPNRPAAQAAVRSPAVAQSPTKSGRRVRARQATVAKMRSRR